MKKERDLVELQPVVKRTACAKQPDGYGPKPAEDTVDAFLNYDVFAVREFDCTGRFVANVATVHCQQCSNSPRLPKILREPASICQRQQLHGLDYV